MKISPVISSNPEDHARRIEEILFSLKEHCRSEINLFTDPHAKALLETSADVLAGLERAFHDYLSKEDDAWKIRSEVYETPQMSSDPWD